MGVELFGRQARLRETGPSAIPRRGQSQDFSLAQNQRLQISVNGWQVRAIGITNLTPFYLHFPDNPGAFQWALPNTVNAVVPVPPSDVIRVNSIDVPAGIAVPTTSSDVAQLTAFEDPIPPSPGAPLPNAPSDWTVAGIAFAPGIGLSHVVTPVAGKQVFGSWFALELTGGAANANVTLQDTAGTPNILCVFYIGANLISVSMPPVDFKNLPIAAAGLGVDILTDQACQLRGCLIYKQA